MKNEFEFNEGLNAIANTCRQMRHFLFKFTPIMVINLLLSFNGYCQMLYGVTAIGGTDNLGTIFHYNVNNDVHTLDNSYMYSVYGNQPAVGLTDGGNGKFYGTTQFGGQYDKGIIFEYDTLTGECIKKVDLSNAIGERPVGEMFLFAGKLYGTTWKGGGFDKGVIFEWDPVTNIYTKKYDFNANEGVSPNGGFAECNSKLYGLTSNGGANDLGVIFEYDPVANVYTKKIDLTVANGSNPECTMLLHNNVFYGTTQTGGLYSKGVIFAWDPVTNIYTKKFDFDGSNGGYPAWNLQKVSNFSGTKFYGVTKNGGANGNGVIYSWNPTTDAYTQLFDFTNATGSGCRGGFLRIGNSLYGSTNSGGAHSKGVIYEWNIATNNYQVWYDLDQNLIGPTGKLLNQNNKLVGLTINDYLFGYGNGFGGCFTFDLNDSTYHENFVFNTTYEGSNPVKMSVSGNVMIGINGSGGATNEGTIFSWNTVTGSYQSNFDFTYGDYWNPVDLCEKPYGNKFFGIASLGGANNGGVIFEYDLLTHNTVAKYNFNMPTGNQANAAPVYLAGKYYGTTSKGGTSDQGVIYEWDPVTNIYNVKFEFSGLNGTYPASTLYYYNGKFYGTTMTGGANTVGVLFEWDPVTNVYVKRKDFDFVSGSNPKKNQLVEYNGKLYGLVEQGGTFANGTLYEWDPVNLTFTLKADLDDIGGVKPQGKLVEYGGKLYGVTLLGGNFGSGLLFEWDPLTDQLTKLYDFNSPTGAVARQLFLFTPDASTINENDQFETDQMLIFPNPADGEFFFKAASEETEYRVKIYSSNGQLLDEMPHVFSGDPVVINHPPGTYFIEISNDFERRYAFNIVVK